MQIVRYAVEGFTDEPVAAKLLAFAGFKSLQALTSGGKSNLDSKLPGLNRAARIESPWLVLRDLDHDDVGKCVPELRLDLLQGQPNTGMCFRIAVRAMETWLLADYKNCARFFGIPLNRMPHDVEMLPDPKQKLVMLCRGSIKTEMRKGMVPRASGGRKVGGEYTALVREFARNEWDPCLARDNSMSLDRAMGCLERLRSRVVDSV